MRWLRVARNDAGDGLVEFALVVVLLVMVLGSVVELGRMALVYTTIANAAKAGTRYAIVHGADRTGSGSTGASGPTCPCTEINTVVTDFATAGLVNTANLTVSVSYPGGTNTVGSTVFVTAQYTYDPLIPFFDPLLSTTLSSTSEGVVTF